MRRQVCTIYTATALFLIFYSDTEDGNDMSRSSSVSVKDRAGQSKKVKPGKQRRDDSESFDVRSQYTPFFAPQQQQQPTWAPIPQFVPVGLPQQFGNPMQSNFQPVNPQSFAQSSQQFSPVMMGPGGMPPYNPMVQVSQQKISEPQ